MSVLTDILESFAELLVATRPESPDDLAKIGTSLRNISTKAAVRPELQALAKKAIGVLECADIPLDVESLAELHRLAHAMLELDGAPGSAAVEPAEPKSVTRDEDTLALFGEFFEESEDALTEADRILMEGEAGLGAEGVHALFRVFHTLKGVAGFLDLEEVAKLAHTTETLLGEVREGGLELGASGHECLLETTKLMRRLVTTVDQAVEKGVAIPSHADAVNRMVEWLSAETRGESREAETMTATTVAKAEGDGDGDAARQRATIKVDVERVDGVLEMIGELVLLESMLTHASEMSDVRLQLTQLAKITRNLQSQAMRMRMVPVRTQFQRLPRIVRDTAKKAGKQVQIEMIGASTEIDRGMVDRLGDPLVHMLRNAVDHGVEAPEVRRDLGKPEMATITVAAFHEGSSVVIEVSDDGRGLDKEAILKKARSKGLVREGQILSDDEVYQLIFEPGFSTAAKVTELSGRGVGMDVVKKTIVGMRGRVVIRSTPGQGTTFRLILPLTLAIIEATVVRVGTERFVIPSLSMVESLQPTPWMLTTMGGHRELVRFRGSVLPLFRGSVIFGVRSDTNLQMATGPAPRDKSGTEVGMLVVVDSGGQHVGLLVDEVIGQQQVVVKNLDGTIAQSESFIGAAILSDGKVALILNVDDLGHLGEKYRIDTVQLAEGTAA